MKNQILKSITLALTLSIMPMTALHAMNEQPKKTENTVSIIYYPSIIATGQFGHVKLEINGMAYNRTGLSFLLTPGHDNPLKELATKANSGGKPFFRFVFDADDETVSRLLQDIKTKPASYATCSLGATSSLRETGISSIPALLSISPATTAIYLAASKQLGLSKIKDIEYYGDPSLLHRLGLGKIHKGEYQGNPSLLKGSRIVPGPLHELMFIGQVLMLLAPFYLKGRTPPSYPYVSMALSSYLLAASYIVAKL